MAQLIRELDWSATPLGEISGWSDTLLTAVNMIVEAPVPMQLFWGPEFVCVYNDAMAPALYDKHPRSMGQPARAVWKEAWFMIGPQMEQVFHEGRAINFSDVLLPLLQDGRLEDHYWTYSYSPVFDPAGNVVGVLDIAQDTTLAVVAERERRLLLEQLEQVHGATTDAIIGIDRDWAVSYMNEQARLAAGPLADSAVGQNFWDSFPAARYEGSPYVEHYERAMNEGKSGTFESFYPDPLNIWVRVRVAPTRTGIVLFFQNTTEERRLAAALMQTEKLAAVGRLASSISHEINNPLEAVTNLLYLISGSEHLGKADREYVEAADKELMRVSQVVAQTLRFHRQSTEASSVELASLFEEVIRLYSVRFEQLGIQVERDYQSGASVTCYEGDIRQVINNLVSNALDAMRSGGRLRLRIRSSRSWKTNEPGIRLTIADTGSGMPDEVLTHVFDAFFSTKGNQGTGLGLWISSGIVRKHQGQLRVRSRQVPSPSGTVFSLWLPHTLATDAKQGWYQQT